jgi:multidrug efflux pump
MSQALTLFTTPVVYLYFDRLKLWFARVRGVPPKRLDPMESEG